MPGYISVPVGFAVLTVVLPYLALLGIILNTLLAQERRRVCRTSSTTVPPVVLTPNSEFRLVRWTEDGIEKTELPTFTATVERKTEGGLTLAGTTNCNRYRAELLSRTGAFFSFPTEFSQTKVFCGNSQPTDVPELLRGQRVRFSTTTPESFELESTSHHFYFETGPGQSGPSSRERKGTDR
jgi:hypothetical protein